jgi:hypothetical protein
LARFLIDGGADTYFKETDCGKIGQPVCLPPVLISKSQNSYYIGFIKIEFNSKRRLIQMIMKIGSQWQLGLNPSL